MGWLAYRAFNVGIRANIQQPDLAVFMPRYVKATGQAGNDGMGSHSRRDVTEANPVYLLFRLRLPGE